MVQFIQDNFNGIYFVVKENQNFQMVDNILENGRMDLKMEKVSSFGPMVENMMDIMLMMKGKDMGFYSGQVVKNIWDYGKKDFFMEMDKF